MDTGLDVLSSQVCRASNDATGGSYDAIINSANETLEGPPLDGSVCRTIC